MNAYLWISLRAWRRRLRAKVLRGHIDEVATEIEFWERRKARAAFDPKTSAERQIVEMCEATLEALRAELKATRIALALIEDPQVMLDEALARRKG